MTPTTKAAQRWIYFCLGWLFTLIGFIGIAVPILPTTPFLILAAFLFSKSSQKWHDWLLRRKGIGPAIADWEKHQIIRRRAKVTASSILIPTVALTCSFTHIMWFAKIAMALTAATVLAFIWTRPENEPR